MKLTFGEIVADLEWRTVRGSDRDERLTEREVVVLRALASADGRPVSVDALIAACWAAGATEQAVHNLMTRLRRKLEPDPEDPRHLRTIRHQGYALRVDPARALSATPAPILLGRGPELERLAAVTTRGAVVTLTGLGGAGKTTLARAWERRTTGRVAWCNLETARDLGDVVRAVATATGAPIEGRDIARDRLELHVWLAGFALVVLDNCEQVRDDVAAVLDGWRGPTTFLATSRVPLGVAGEVLVDVGPLPADAARALFGWGARLAVDGFELNDETRPIVDRIVDRLDRLPLAITLGAGRLAVYTPAELLARLTAALDLLTSARRDLPERQRALRVALDGSTEPLAPYVRDVLAALSTFPGAFSVDAAEAVGPPGDALDALHTLHAASLVQASADDEPRLSLYETVREHADGLLVGPARASALDRHARWCVEAASPWVGRLYGPREAEALARISALLPDLLAVVDRGGAPERVVDAALAADVALIARGPFGPHEALVDRAVALARGGGPQRLARALLARGRVRDLRAIDAQADLLEAAQVAGDAFPAQASDAWLALAIIRHREGVRAPTREAVNAALAAAERAADADREARARAFLDMVAWGDGEHEFAFVEITRATAALAELGDVRAEASAQVFVGAVHRLRGDDALAGASYTRGFELATQVGDAKIQAHALSNIGRMLLDRRPAEAVGIILRAREFARLLGDRRNEGLHTVHAARGQVLIGDVDAAIVALDRILHELSGDGPLCIAAGYVRAAAFARAGRWAQAREAVDALVVVPERDHELVGLIAALRAVVWHRTGDRDGALAALAIAASLREELLLAAVADLADAIVDGHPLPAIDADTAALDVRLFATFAAG